MRFVAPFLSTRCIGCYIGKAGYKDSSYLSGASSEPVISQPEIVGPIAVDESCRFLVLMSGGLCKTLRDIYSNETSIVNREIVQMIVEQVSHTAHFPLDNWIGMYNYLCHLTFLSFFPENSSELSQHYPVFPNQPFTKLCSCTMTPTCDKSRRRHSKVEKILLF